MTDQPQSAQLLGAITSGANFVRVAVFLSFTLSLSVLTASFSPAARGTDAASRSPTQTYRAQALQDMASGHPQEALESYKEAIKAAKTQYGQESTYLSELYFEMGNLARSNKQSELAQSCYRNAVKYRPNDIPARLQLAELERNTKNVLGAFEDSKKAYKQNQTLATTRKELMLCMQQCGRPAEAALIGATLNRSNRNLDTGRNMPKIPSSVPDTSAPPAASAPAETSGPVVTSASVSALHWAPGIRKKAEDEAAAKRLKEQQAAAAEAKRKEAEAELQKKNEKHAKQKDKEEADHKAKQKAKKDDAKKAAAAKSKAAAQAPAEPQLNSASLKTSAKAIQKADEKSEKTEKTEKSEKSEKAEKPKSRANISAVTEKTEKPAAEKQESSVSENEPAKKNVPAAERPQPVQMQQSAPMTVSVPDMSKKGKAHRGPSGLVPPPPATPFIIPSFPPMPQPIQVQAPAPKPKPKPKPAVKEAPKESEEATSTKTPAAEDNSDPDFLINWGDGGSKKKHKK